MRSPLLLAIFSLLWAAPAAAGPDGQVVDKLPDRAAVDWSRGLLTAVGAAGADLAAPSPAVARVGAERTARAVARRRLLDLAGNLAVAGVPVRERTLADPAAAARLAGAVDRALDLEVDYSTDGSVVITAALPLEAIRLALAGPPAPPTAAGPTALLVDAGAALTAPALGLTLTAGGERYAGPTVFHRNAAAAAKDPRAGATLLRARASAATGSSLEIDLPAADLAAARASGALVIVVLGVPK